jgi:hypothetical protein
MDDTKAMFLAEGFEEAGPDFLQGPQELAFHNERPYLIRTCYEFIDGRWEGFVSMDMLDEPATEI